MDQGWTVKKGKHCKEGGSGRERRERGGPGVLKNQRPWREGRKLEGGGFRSFWDTEIYILIDGGFLAMTMGV